jgi:hypothetical protein
MQAAARVLAEMGGNSVVEPNPAARM